MALRPPIELFLPNTNERCILTLLYDHYAIADNEEVALARGYKTSAVNAREEGSDIFSVASSREPVVARIYMPRSFSWASWTDPQPGTTDERTKYSACRSYWADKEMAALLEAQSGCEDVPLVIASIIKDPTGIFAFAPGSDFAVKVLHFVVLMKRPGPWFETGLPNGATQPPMLAQQLRASRHDRLSPSRGPGLKERSRKVVRSPADATSTMAPTATKPEDTPIEENSTCSRHGKFQIGAYNRADSGSSILLVPYGASGFKVRTVAASSRYPSWLCA